MSELTKEWLQQTIAELEEERDAAPGVVNEDAANALAAMKIAQASLEANGTLANEGTITTMPFKPVADLYGLTSPTGGETSFTFDAVEARDFIGGGWSCQEYVELGRFQEAMLQGAEPVKTANKLPFEQWLYQQTGTIDVECGCVMTEVFFHWLRVAYEAGNSPVIPDGWVACSERMPEREIDVQVYCSDKKEQMVGYMERNERDGYFRFASLPNGGGVYCQPTHWMPLPAAPRQEVK